MDRRLPVTNKKENQTIHANSEITAENQQDVTPLVLKEDKTPHTPRKVALTQTCDVILFPFLIILGPSPMDRNLYLL